MGDWIEVEEACRKIETVCGTLSPRTREVDVEHAVGLVLAAPVESDIDVPPYRKALMDGYAVRAADVADPCRLQVTDEITAGDLPSARLAAGQAARIMTGAPLPAGADAVVKVEDTDRGTESVAIQTAVSPGDNMMEAGYCSATGDTIVPAGRTIEAHHVGLLCEIGGARVSVVEAPQVAVLSTGDELVSATEFPGPGRIRNTNAPLLAALAQRDGAVATNLGIARDEPEEIAAHIRRGLEHDVLILSGGVSAGIRDLVPGTLAALDVEQVFHGVRLKPGKPIWFGVGRQATATTLVFGLPGNPLSSLVCYELFVRRAIDLLAGRGVIDRSCRRVLADDFSYRSGRRTFHPARLAGADRVRLLPWKGSVDQRVLVETDALVDLPEHAVPRAGMNVTVYRL